MKNIETSSEGREPNRYVVVLRNKEVFNMQFETISSISTPVGEGAIAIVRLSGEDGLKLQTVCIKVRKL